MSRHRQSWQAFVERALRFREHEHLYYGVCFLNKKDDVDFAHGCFRGADVAVGSDAAEPFDGAQFRRAFEQYARIAIAQSATTAAVHPGTSTSALDAVAAVRLGSRKLQVVSTSFTSLCAVSPGQRYGLVAQRLPFGVLVVVFRHPHTLQDVAPVVDECCASLR